MLFERGDYLTCDICKRELRNGNLLKIKSTSVCNGVITKIKFKRFVHICDPCLHTINDIALSLRKRDDKIWEERKRQKRSWEV